jgi:hypothetical protein
LRSLAPGERRAGAAVVETPFSSIVVDPGSLYWKQSDGSLVIALQTADAA